MQWFRLYHEIVDDPKVGTLNDSEFRLWIEILCLASMKRSGGDTGLTIPQAEWKLRRNISDAIETLETRGLIEITGKGTIFVTKWEKRQFNDSSCERVKKYREKIKDMGLKTNGYTKHRETVTQRDGNCCIYCGSRENLCIDHILPVSMGGDDSIENLGLACKECNSGKAGRTPDMASYTWFNTKTKVVWEEWMAGKKRLHS